MHLTPHEILKHLGFDIPPEGVEVSSGDVFLHTQMLKLLGRTMSVDAIPLDELQLHSKFISNMGAVLRGAEPTNTDGTEELKILFETILQMDYKPRPTLQKNQPNGGSNGTD